MYRTFHKGFTLIELLVVLTIMATLLAIVTPKYFNSVDKAKEAVLKANLRLTREAIDKYKADHQRYPDTLKQLVIERYLSSVPTDPFTDSVDSWVLLPPPSRGDLGFGAETPDFWWVLTLAFVR